MQQDAAAKVLVFSSWQDVLELVSHALQTNKLPYAYARGRKAFDTAVAHFKQSETSNSGRILLLLVKQGANGLNLTGESRCVLIVFVNASLVADTVHLHHFLTLLLRPAQLSVLPLQFEVYM